MEPSLLDVRRISTVTQSDIDLSWILLPVFVRRNSLHSGCDPRPIAHVRNSHFVRSIDLSAALAHAYSLPPLQARLAMGLVPITSFIIRRFLHSVLWSHLLHYHPQLITSSCCWFQIHLFRRRISFPAVPSTQSSVEPLCPREVEENRNRFESDHKPYLFSAAERLIAASCHYYEIHLMVGGFWSLIPRRVRCRRC